ncbi:hypothetical protein DFP73DRAFT_569733 [Morchella snyderi]|nr:hypothetical protein DFP73DRAFT_569733 [Morchella snyderi]
MGFDFDFFHLATALRWCLITQFIYGNGLVFGVSSFCKFFVIYILGVFFSRNTLGWYIYLFLYFLTLFFSY